LSAEPRFFTRLLREALLISTALSCFGEASRAFHDLPESVKADSTINSAHRGYIAPKSSTTRVSSVTEVRRPNTSESFMRMHEVPASDPRFGNPLQGPNQCPSLATGSRWFRRYLLSRCNANYHSGRAGRSASSKSPGVGHIKQSGCAS
jgi:hypothetical protein